MTLDAFQAALAERGFTLDGDDMVAVHQMVLGAQAAASRLGEYPWLALEPLATFHLPGAILVQEAR